MMVNLFIEVKISEVHLEPSRTPTMDCFLQKQLIVLSVDYFHQKGSIVDIRLDSKYASGYSLQ